MATKLSDGQFMRSFTKEAYRKILHKDEASAIIIARLTLSLEKSPKLDI